MNSFYMNRLIKIVSPINEEIFTIQLGGSEEELKELIGTILNINPQSIKGIRDSFGNYHTISSAIMNKNLTMGYSQFYYIVINNNQNISPHNNNNTMILEKNNLNFYQNYNFGNKSPIIKNKDDGNFNNFIEQNEKIAFRLFNENLIDKNKYDLLKKMLNEQNDEILTLFKLYINHGKDIKKLSKQIFPILNNINFPNKNNSNKIDEAIRNVNISNINININNSKKYLNILNSIKNIFNYQNSEIDLLKRLLLCDNGYILKAFEDYSLTNNQNAFKSSLDFLIKNYSERFFENTINDENIINNDKNKEINKKEDTKRKKYNNSIGKEKKISKKIEKIENKILKLFSSEEASFQPDCIFLFKADMQKLTPNEKLNLFENEFKIKEKNSPIDSNSKNLIKEYYKNQLKNKYFKNFNPNEISIYEDLIKSNNENIINAYKNFIKTKNSDELSSEIRKWILQILEEREKLENNTSSNLSEEEENENENEENESEENENEESDNEESENINEEEKKEEEEEESSLHSSTSEAMNNTSESDSENGKKIKKINTNNNNNLNNRGSFIINKTSRKKYDASQLLTNNYRLNTLRKLNNDDKNSNNNINNNINNQEQKLTLVSLKKAEEIANENSRREQKKLLINIPTSDRKINDFIKVINGMNIDENSKSQILELINNKNEEIMKVYEKYQKNKLYLTKKVLLNLLSKNERNNNSNNNINTNNTNKTHNSKKNNTLSFENFLKNLENENKLTKPKVQFLIKEFNSGNNMIQSLWEVYKKEKDEDELKENLEIFLKKYENKIKNDISKQSKNLFVKEMNGGKTPLSIQSFKKDLVNYLKTTERKETKTKQKKIIDLLIKEHFLNPSSQKFFYEKISNEVKEVTAAFEVFSVTLNHIDFSETLNLIYDLVMEGYKDDNSKKNKDDNSKKNKDNNNKKNKDNNSKKNNKNEFLIRLTKVLDKGKFNDNEKTIIKEEFDKSNNILMSILEVFDEDDIEDSIDSIKSFIAKIIHTKGL